MNATTRKIHRLLLEWQTANEAGESVAADRLLRQAIELDDGTDDNARTKSGMLVRLRAYLVHANQLRLHDPLAALDVLDRARTRWPDDSHVHLLTGRIHLSQDDGVSAYPALLRSFELDARAGTCLWIGSALDKLQRSPEALVWLHRALEVDPANEEAHYNLGRVRERAGDLEGAIASFRRAIEIDPDYALAHAGLGELLIATRPTSFDHPDWIEAIQHCRRAVELDPNDGWTHARLATIDVNCSVADTKTHHRAAMRLLPRAAPIWSDYADFASCRQLEPSAEVDRLFRYAIELDPSNGATRYFFAHHLWRTNRRGQARSEIQEAHRLGHPKALAWLAEEEAALA